MCVPVGVYVLVCMCVCLHQWRFVSCVGVYPPDLFFVAAKQERRRAREGEPGSPHPREKVASTGRQPLRVVGHNDPGPARRRAALDHLLTQRRLMDHQDV